MTDNADLTPALDAGLQKKFAALQACLKALGSVAVAFSGGVDSTLLLKAAHDILGDSCIAVTASSLSYPERELREAQEFCRTEGIRHYVCRIDELAIPGYAQNPPNRCYLCKKALFTQLQQTAAAHGIAHIAEGSNMDDNGDYRPGLLAVREMGIASPLRQAQLSKEDIRALSRALGLPTAEKPAFACLASRFVYGERLTEEKLQMVGAAEQYLFEQGFGQLRVRLHGKMARIELLPRDFAKMLSLREEVTQKLRRLGFAYVTLDLAGYRTGSMNETLTRQDKNSF